MANQYIVNTASGLAIVSDINQDCGKSIVTTPSNIVLDIVDGSERFALPATIESGALLLCCVMSNIACNESLTDKQVDRMNHAQSNINSNILQRLEPENVKSASITKAGSIWLSADCNRDSADVITVECAAKLIERGGCEVDIFYSKHYISALIDRISDRISELEKLAINARDEKALDGLICSISTISKPLVNLLHANINLSRNVSHKSSMASLNRFMYKE